VAGGGAAVDVRRSYLKLARENHPDANPSPDAAAIFVQLGRTYELLMKRIRDGQDVTGANELEEHEDDEDGEYDEDDVRAARATLTIRAGLWAVTPCRVANGRTCA